MSEVAAFLANGPSDWYANLARMLAEHDKTWLQQRKQLVPRLRHELDRAVERNGHIWILAYRRNPARAAVAAFKATEYVTGRERIPPPDATAPPFFRYDIEEGRCRDEFDYKYRTWVRLVDAVTIKELEPHDLRKLTDGEPLRSVHGHGLISVVVPAGILPE